jgi:hypothetical protein
MRVWNGFEEDREFVLGKLKEGFLDHLEMTGSSRRTEIRLRRPVSWLNILQWLHKTRPASAEDFFRLFSPHRIAAGNPLVNRAYPPLEVCGEEIAVSAKVPGYAPSDAAPFRLEPGETTRVELVLHREREFQVTVRDAATGAPPGRRGRSLATELVRRGMSAEEVRAGCPSPRPRRPPTGPSIEAWPTSQSDG